MSTPVLQFSPDAAGVYVDLEKLVPSRLLVQGSSGAGKSWLIRYILEQTHGRIQQFVFDPEGEFVTLRERFDYVVASAGGDGDVRAHPDTAALLCRQLVQLQASAIFDIYELEPEQREDFVGRFLTQLLNMPKDQWRSGLVVCDEAHELAPQAGQPPSRKPMELLVSKGRKRGLCAIFATQRVSKLSKNASDMQNVLIGLTGLDTDVKRAGELLGFDREQREQLKRLEEGRGEFFAFGPAISREVVKVRSGDVQTHHPKPGEIRAPTPPATGELAELIAQMAATAAAGLEEEEDEDAADAPRARRAPEGWVSPAEVDRRVRTAVAEAEARGRAEGAAAAIAEIRSDLRPHVVEIYHRLANGTAPASPRVTPAPAPTATRGGLAQPSRAKTSPPPAPPPRAPRKSGKDAAAIGGTHRRILNALAMLEALGIGEPGQPTVAGWVGVSSKSGTWRNRLSELRSAGLIRDLPGKALTLTDAGRDLAEPAKTPPTLAELHDVWRAKLGGTAARMLTVIIDAYPEPISKQELAGALGVEHTSGTFRNRLSELRGPGIVQNVERGGDVIATELLFPAGLR